MAVDAGMNQQEQFIWNMLHVVIILLIGVVVWYLRKQNSKLETLWNDYEQREGIHKERSNHDEEHR